MTTNAKIFTTLFPDGSRLLLTGSGKAFVEQLGIEAIRKSVLAVLCGENIRSQTEPLTRRRISMVSGALVKMFANGWTISSDFQSSINHIAADLLNSRSSKADKWIAQWILGLTGKSVQNVLRGESQALANYLANFESTLSEVANYCEREYGKMPFFVEVRYTDGTSRDAEWLDLLRLLTTIGSMTLALRGSDKSLYGKLFERLVLGSVLSVLGFEAVNRNSNTKTDRVFWLSDSRADRECDATLLFQLGQVVRFDIGFIGSGNSEISKDKLSRFSKELDLEGITHESNTFIIIDRLPQTNKTIEQANRVGATIIQMSMQYWPRQLAKALSARFNYKHPLQDLPDDQVAAFLKDKIQAVNLQNFVSGIDVEEAPETLP